MKKLYYLDNSERNRILEMHNKATKNQYLLTEGAGTEQDPYNVQDVQYSVDWIIKYIDYWMTEEGMKNTLNNIKVLFGKWYLDDTNEQDKKLVNALKKAKELYQEDEGENLLDELQNIGKTTWGATAVDNWKKAINLLQQADTVADKPFGQGGAQGKCKGWDWNKVQKKYSCTSPDMFYGTTPKCGDYGDYLEAKINDKKYTFFIGDGHLYGENNKDLGYFACKGGKLEKTSVAYMDKTNQDMTPQMESKKIEFVRMITESGWGDVGDSGGGGGGGDKKERKHRGTGSTGSSSGGYLSNLQNKIAELDTSYKPTGSMDQTTINKVMELLTKGVKPPEPTPTPYQVNQTTNNAQSED